MAKLDIAPPPPPKLEKEEVVEKKVEKKVPKVKPEKISKKKEEPSKSDIKNETEEERIEDLEEEIAVEDLFPKEKKKRFGFFRRKEKKEDGEELDLDKLRSQFNIPPAEEKIAEEKKVSKKDVDWTSDKITGELLKEDAGIPVPVKEKKVTTKKSVTKKAVAKKPITKKAPVTKAKKMPVRGAEKIDRVIEEYFKSVEREQELIQKELEMIVIHPKKALRKTATEYIIHHNEKLIKSMKDLLAAIKSIEDEKFDTKVAANKKAFYKWVKGILDEEKKAEAQRNNILKQKIGQLMKNYGAGINKDIIDKKYELNAQKKDADRSTKEAEKFEAKIKKLDLDLKAREKNLKGLIESGIQKVIETRLRKEKNALSRAEATAHRQSKVYHTKHENFKLDVAKFNMQKTDAEELLKQGMALKRKKTMLENKDIKLKDYSEELATKEAHLNDKFKVMEEREKEAKKILKREENLRVGEREVELEKLEINTKNNELDLREKEVKDMEKHMGIERGELANVKAEVVYHEEHAKEQLEEVREIQQEIELEETRFMQDRENAKKTDFREYMKEKYMDEEATENTAGVDEFYTMIENCRKMIRNSDYEEAKKNYSYIREQFSKADVGPKHKEILYNSIRELYDDIYLAIISTTN